MTRPALALLMASWAAALRADVPYARIRAAEREPGSWLTYSGTYRSQRYSALSQIDAANVASLRPVWIYQLDIPGTFECTPLVADDVMYLTEPPSTVTALDVRTGRRYWMWQARLPTDVRSIGFPPVNRGVALLDDRVFAATLDAHLVALDAKSGIVRWNVEVADNAKGYAITSAPLAIDGKIVIGVSGGEAGIRGFVDAYDAGTGVLAWRCWTVPGPGEPGSKTWGADSWKTGGGATWLTGSYDPKLNLLYWSTGNPGPDWNGDARPGDNLYTCSLLAIDAVTGKVRWHFQFTPHDTHDWDANQIPVLVDAPWGGRVRPLVVTANRNAFYYVLDRRTGEFLVGAPYSKQTWAKGLDARGRPIMLPDSEPSEKGPIIWPSSQGATNWQSPAYSPLTGWFYVAVRLMGSRYYKGEPEYEPGNSFLGGGAQAMDGDASSGAIRALDLATGRLQWEFPLHSPPWAGLLSTAGGLVFGGSNEGHFFALDARSGKALWQFQTGGLIRASPVTFLVDGKQRIAVASGNALFVFGL